MAELERARFAVRAMVEALARLHTFDRAADSRRVAYAAIEAALWHRALQDHLWPGTGGELDSEDGQGVRFVANKGIHDSIAEVREHPKPNFFDPGGFITIASNHTYKWRPLSEWSDRVQQPNRDERLRDAYVATLQDRYVVHTLVVALVKIRDQLDTSVDPTGEITDLINDENPVPRFLM